MFEVKGKYNTAYVYQDEDKVECIDQIREISNCEAYRGCNVRIMPDVHLGASSPIGFTVKLKGRVVPATVGVDINCGMYIMKLGKLDNIDFEDFDNYIRANIPSGRNIREEKIVSFEDIYNLRCIKALKNIPSFERSLATLGSGNHFEELDKDSEGNIYFVVHTGSRNLGKQVAEYYQDLAYTTLNYHLGDYNKERESLIKTYKEEGRQKEIQTALNNLKQKYNMMSSEEKVSKDYAYLEGENLEDYLHDIEICQRYATLNRETICRLIAKYFGLDFESLERFETVHNYIDLKNGILRKGAIAAYEGVKVIIPINMAEGSIIGVGKSCAEMNYSAPHGAGRMLSRIKAKENLNVEEFKASMKNVWSSCVNEGTLDESPMAYKSLKDIIPNIRDTVDVVEVIKPIYNFKAEEA